MKKKLLEDLRKNCGECCKACELHETRHNVVFSDGNPETAKIVLVGEAPGENEDLQGIPFVGRAGKLLNEFLAKARLSREKDLYIINTVKCRPPKNRVPTDAEKETCRPVLLSQIKIIDPEIILLCGATALKSFTPNVTLNSLQGIIGERPCDAETSSARRKILNKTPISKIRGEIFDIEVQGKIYKAMPIFHPSYLLRNHSLEPNSPRDLMLNDLKKVKKII